MSMTRPNQVQKFVDQVDLTSANMSAASVVWVLSGAPSIDRLRPRVHAEAGVVDSRSGVAVVIVVLAVHLRAPQTQLHVFASGVVRRLRLTPAVHQMRPEVAPSAVAPYSL